MEIDDAIANQLELWMAQGHLELLHASLRSAILECVNAILRHIQESPKRNLVFLFYDMCRCLQDRKEEIDNLLERIKALEADISNTVVLG